MSIVIFLLVLLPIVVGESYFSTKEKAPSEKKIVEKPPDWLLVPWKNNTYGLEPKMAIDSNGFIHIVYIGGEVFLAENSSTIDENATVVEHLYYIKLDPKGNLTSGPTQLSGESNGIWHPCIDIDSSGRASIAWTMEVPNGHSEVAFARVGANGEVLVKEMLIAQDEVRSIRPSIAVDRDGNAHVVFSDSHGSTLGGTYNWELHYSKIDSSGKMTVNNRAWGDFHLRSSGFADIAVDSRGILHVVNIQLSPTFMNTEIHYRCFSNDGVFLGVNQRLTHIYSSGHFPKIDIDSEDQLHIAWYDSALSQDYGYGVWYMRLGPGGVIRQRPVEITNETSCANIFFMYTVNIEVAKNGEIYVSWHSRDNMFYNKWTKDDVQRKDGIFYANSNDGVISLDPQDNLHVAWMRTYNYNNITWAHIDYKKIT